MNGLASSSSRVYPRMRANAGLASFRYPSDPAMHNASSERSKSRTTSLSKDWLV
jgi:hypothetical protein